MEDFLAKFAYDVALVLIGVGLTTIVERLKR